MIKQCGLRSVQFEKPPIITTYACVAGEKEGDGPIGHLIDEIIKDPMCGMKTWEEAESYMQTKVVRMLLDKSKLPAAKIRYILAGDLLGQLIATSFGLKDYEIPLFGLYGACSTMGESMSLGAMLTAGGIADRVIAMTSSHFASAERQFRFPLEYGNQRPLSATWTVSGSGGVIIENVPNPSCSAKGKVGITGVTTGVIVDYGVHDSMNMGACMAPACAETLKAHFQDMNVGPDHYDKIFTGDLGFVGKRILFDLCRENGYDISSKHVDCGMIIYNQKTQDTHSGGSGCGCSAVTLCSYILRQLEEGNLRRVLFIPTGALLSTVSYNEGMTVPGIAHAVVLERIE